MKQRLQGMVVGVLATVLLLGTANVLATSTRTISVVDGINVAVNGRQLQFVYGSAPFISDGTTFMPVRAIADALEVDAEWDGETSTVHLRHRASTALPPAVSIPPIPEPLPIPPTLPQPEHTPEPTAPPTQTTSGYQRIFDEYSEKIRTSAPTVSLMELAEIANQGVLRMAEYMFSATGVDGQMTTYQMWAEKLMAVYMEYAR